MEALVVFLCHPAAGRACATDVREIGSVRSAKAPRQQLVIRLELIALVKRGNQRRPGQRAAASAISKPQPNSSFSARRLNFPTGKRALCGTWGQRGGPGSPPFGLLRSAFYFRELRLSRARAFPQQLTSGRCRIPPPPAAPTPTRTMCQSRANAPGWRLILFSLALYACTLRISSCRIHLPDPAAATRRARPLPPPKRARRPPCPTGLLHASPRHH